MVDGMPHSVILCWVVLLMKFQFNHHWHLIMFWCVFMLECVEDIPFVYRILFDIQKYMIYFPNHSFLYCCLNAVIRCGWNNGWLCTSRNQYSKRKSNICSGNCSRSVCILKNTISSSLRWNIAEPSLLTLDQDFKISVLRI